MRALQPHGAMRLTKEQLLDAIHHGEVLDIQVEIAPSNYSACLHIKILLTQEQWRKALSLKERSLSTKRLPVDPRTA